MSFGLAAFWILVGWCGTPPRPWPWPPEPDPDPWVIKVVGMVGGLVGGFVMGQYFDIIVVEGMVSTKIATTGIGAYVGSYILGDMYNLIKSRSQK